MNQTAFDFLKEKQEDKVNNFFKENENRIRLTLHPTNSYYYDQAAFKLKIQVNRAYIVKNIQTLMLGFLKRNWNLWEKHTDLFKSRRFG